MRHSAAAEKRRSFAPQLVLALAVMTMLAGLWGVAANRPASSRPAVLSTDGPMVSETRCAECHSDITDTFAATPHARTLRHTSEAGIAERFAGRSFTHPHTGARFSYQLEDGRLTVSTPAYARTLAIEWIFGSGTHAQTPLITWTDDEGRTQAIEHCVSWYPSGDLAATLGTEALTDASGIHALGHHRGPAQTMNCFGCHSRHVPNEDGQIHFAHIQAGIGCARCHWDVEQHVLEMDRGDDATIERFSALTPRDAVDRCGECHRRAQDMGGPIEPDDESIARFAPVGLVQSPCFLQQETVRLPSGEPARLDCTSCHDPHRPSSNDWRSYTQACHTCHDGAHHRASVCSSPRTEQNCLPCHMPKIPANEHLEFTDHWIRVRLPGE
ncbi:MAG: multiheme c-type cytochrome [Maioricimonas sp. JB049]